eukprot:7995643-Heterocapsa_arctica.AAC.1
MGALLPKDNHKSGCFGLRLIHLQDDMGKHGPLPCGLHHIGGHLKPTDMCLVNVVNRRSCS